MGNSLTTNPMRIEDTATTAFDEQRFVRLVQWVDDAGDIIDNSTLVLTIDGCALTVKYQMLADISPLIVLWQIGPFNPGILIRTFVVTTMATGHLHIWLDHR